MSQASLLALSLDLNNLIISVIIQLTVNQGPLNQNIASSYNIPMSFNESDVLSQANKSGRQNWSAADCAALAAQVLGLPVSSNPSA